jgi:photosystem II stability/assembly factor-like uncharacterized protein
LLAAATLGASALFAGCATAPSTSVSRETALQGNEGVVVMRLVNLGSVPLNVMRVMPEGSSDALRLDGVQFGQMQSITLIGRLPAGRYQPTELWGSNGAVTRTAPLTKLTGKFEVQAGRVTDLGTMSFTPYDAVMPDTKATPGEVSGSMGNSLGFLAPIDPTPVPVKPLLATRFPQLARSLKDEAPLGWVASSAPAQRAELMNVARHTSSPVSSPVSLPDGRMLGGGALGTVGAHATNGSPPRIFSIGAVQHIQAVAVLKDGRWLAGGEEGLVAVSEDKGLMWQRLPGLGVHEVVIHLSQAPDGTLHLVTMHDGGSTVYASAARPVAWKEVRRIAAERDFVRLMSGVIFRDDAATTNERLVIHTRPETITTLDYRTGQWESHKTPRAFNHGLRATPDGFVVGIHMNGWIYGSLDYGKSWNRLESWVNMSMPTFIDRNRGFMVAADVSMTGFVYKLRRTEDGGKTWTTGEASGGGWGWSQPFWSDAKGTTLYTARYGRIESSTDLGRTWQ